MDNFPTRLLPQSDSGFITPFFIFCHSQGLVIHQLTILPNSRYPELPEILNFQSNKKSSDIWTGSALWQLFVCLQVVCLHKRDVKESRFCSQVKVCKKDDRPSSNHLGVMAISINYKSYILNQLGYTGSVNLTIFISFLVSPVDWD